MWSQIFLILSCILSAVYVFRRLDNSPLIYLLANLTILSLVIGYIFKLVNTEFLVYTVEIILLITLLLTLITLMISVRLFQPDHLRYPIFYSYVPILILPFYLFYIDNHSLSDLIMMILQSSAYLVYLVLIIAHQKGLKNNWLLMLSLLFFLSSFVFYWALDFSYEWTNTFIDLFVAAGILTGSMSFPGLINKASR